MTCQVRYDFLKVRLHNALTFIYDFNVDLFGRRQYPGFSRGGGIIDFMVVSGIVLIENKFLFPISQTVRKDRTESFGSHTTFFKMAELPKEKSLCSSVFLYRLASEIEKNNSLIQTNCRGKGD